MTSLPGVDSDQLRRNLAKVEAAIAETCLKTHRTRESVCLIAVTKYVDEHATRKLVELGIRDLGESRPQVIWQKHEALADHPDLRWHMIGHLQRNKANRTVPLLSWLHSVDSQRLAEATDEAASKSGICLDILVEVNVTRDSEKTGLPVAEVRTVVDRILEFKHLRLRGLMAMSTEGSDERLARNEFAAVRELRDTLQREYGPRIDLAELSMGMSGDFEWAIAEGSTMIRVGSALWENVVQPNTP